MTAVSPQSSDTTTRRREMKTKKFTGSSIEDATRRAKEAHGADLLRVEPVREVHQATATAQGPAADQALQEVVQRFPEEAFDRQPASLVQEGKKGTVEVEEFDEREARKVWRKTALRGAQIDEMECAVPVKNGIMGMGRRPGRWTVRWTAPYIAEAGYKMPAVVNAMHWG
ncbi:MAG: hypothetical protein O7I93_04610 [Gemmatimonadetes bacterium]|nr:hypothetical protein [Gemmatimonadota bacterium]